MSVEDTDWQRLSPLAVIYWIVRIARNTVGEGWAGLAAVGAWAATVVDEHPGAVVAGALVIVTALLLAAVLSYLRFGYCVADGRLRVQRGVLRREQLVLDFAGVQSVDLQLPWYFRPFGLIVLRVDSAGSAQGEVHLPGVSLPNAERLRERIYSERTERPAPSGADTAVGQAPALLSLGPRDLVLYGLTNDTMLWAAVVLAPLARAADAGVGENWSDALMDSATALTGDRFIAGLGLFAAALLAVIVVLTALSVAGAFVRFQGFTLWRSGGRFRQRGGLASKEDRTLDRAKIQSVVCKQTWLARAIGRYELILRQAGQLPAEAQPQAAAQRFTIPGVDAHRTASLLPRFLPGLKARRMHFSRVHRGYIGHTLRWRVVAPTVVGALALSIGVGWAALAVLLIVPVAIPIVHRYWRCLGYAVDGAFAATREGFLGQRWRFFPLFKVHRIDFRQSPWHRRQDLVDVHLWLADGPAHIPCVPRPDAETLRDLVCYHVEATGKAWI